MPECQGQDNMALTEPSYPMTSKPEYSNTAKAYDNNNQTNFMKMIEIFIEGMANYCSVCSKTMPGE